MYKKGFSEHIDWVIGIGIFLVYLGLVFVIFKPGVTPVFDSETLLDIVENNFLDYNTNNGGALWSINKTPIFITPRAYGNDANPCSPQNTLYPQSVVILKDFSSNLNSAMGFSFGDFRQNELFLIPEKEDLQNNNIEGERFRGNVGAGMEQGQRQRGDEEVDAHRRVDDANAGEDAPVLDLRPFSVGFTYVDADSSLKFIVPLKRDKASKFLLLHAESSINSGGGFPAFDPNKVHDDPVTHYNQGCYFANGVDPEGCDPVEARKCIVRYDFGTTEPVEGINVDNILSARQYNTIKSAWKFPDLKEFQIVIYDQEREYGRFPDVALPAGINIYSRQVNSFILNKDGIRIPVTVNFMVW